MGKNIQFEATLFFFNCGYPIRLFHIKKVTALRAIKIHEIYLLQCSHSHLDNRHQSKILQSETNEAVNSITLDTLSTPKFDLSSLVEDEEMPLSKEENSDIQGRATNKCGLSDKNRVVVNENDEEIDYVEPIVNLMDGKYNYYPLK